MDDKQIQDIADRVIDALNHLAPHEPSLFAYLAAFSPVVALIAAGLVTWVGLRNLKHQQTALGVSVQNDDRSEWWKRAQWALEAYSSDNDKLNAAGTEMLKLLVKSDMASEDDKNLLDTAWKAGTPAVSEEAAEEFLADIEEFEADLDDPPETSENEESKEPDND